MVRTCNLPFPKEHPYKKIFSQYPFELSNFQKYAIQAIEQEKHILITAHTGSGKTLPAEYAIEKYCRQGKKVIYTSPIKCLANQKFHDFSKKFPDISFGILTGDIKTNPEADCLIMTTEILRNTLFQKQMVEEKTLTETQSSLHFEIDIHNELAVVIFDEVHYINDADRGRVWEETIMMLPQQVLMVMLSATIDPVMRFAEWIEREKKREVWWAATNHRVVPLSHYTFFTLRAALSEKHGQQNNLIDTKLHKPLLLRHSNGQFQDKHYHDLSKIITYCRKNNLFINRSFVLNRVVEYLREHNLLPAICFVFSRKKTEEYAYQISHSLHDGKTMNIIAKRCKQILMLKLPNYQEYIELPEYLKLVKILVKGIAHHHSGMLPVFKEMIELLFAEGYIKILFATETFAVGINMPAKTVLFTSLQKFDGHHFRYLHSYEYTQMAGRAGRRGIDTKGVVIHLNNMFDFPTFQEYKQILCGNPQQLLSKFKIHFNLILRLLSVQQDFGTFIKQSMLQDVIKRESKHLIEEGKALQESIQKKETLLQYCKTSLDVLNYFKKLENDCKYASRKVIKKIRREISQMKAEHKYIEDDIQKIHLIDNLKDKLARIDKDIQYSEHFVEKNVQLLLDILLDYQFIKMPQDSESYELTEKGVLASNIQEVNCLAFGELLAEKQFNDLDPAGLACVFSCFANISIPRDTRSPKVPSSIPLKVQKIIDTIQCYYDEISNIELGNNIDQNDNYEMQFELCDLVLDWCSLADDDSKCKEIYSRAKARGISMGEFIKAILKINNIANEFEKVCLIQPNLELLEKLRKIPELTLKSVATAQSLYL